jgi:carbamate kinase
MRVVIALGGNALLRRGEAMTAEAQRANIKVAAEAICRVVDAGHQVLITHGNGPQIGFLAMQTDAEGKPQSMPLDVLNAETVGMIGYMIEQELENLLPPGKRVVTILTQIEIDPADAAFLRPTKPIGPIFGEAEAEGLKKSRAWHFAPEGNGFRRVVASPAPKHVLELEAIQVLMRHGMIVICAGGGGVPIARDRCGKISGVEAVIDKDHASALLAGQVTADALLMLTDVEGVYEDWGKPAQRKLDHLSCGNVDAKKFETGSMRPKIEAALNFIEHGGTIAGIGKLSHALEILQRRAGTTISE